MRLSYTITALSLVIALTGCVEPSPTFNSQMHYTNPNYTILESDGNVEIRSYQPLWVAEIVEQGDRETAMRKGFQNLNAYFRGDNDSQQIIPMTRPVVEFPVAGSGIEGSFVDNKAWVVRFVLPVELTPDTIPQPSNSFIRIVQTNPMRVISYGYSGPWTDANIMNHEAMLQDYARNDNIPTVGVPAYAFYDSPSVAPYSRRNEILMKLADY